MKNIFFFLLTLCLINTSCDPSEGGENDEELITTLVYTLTPVAGGTPVVFSYKDLDGLGGNAPVIVGGTLPINTEFNGEITIKNESVSPVVDLNPEIINEGTAHQFFISVTEGLINSIQYIYKDTDNGGRPIGLKTTFKTKVAGSGSLAVILRHNPNKSASGVINGSIINAGGESDIEVTFPLVVK